MLSAFLIRPLSDGPQIDFFCLLITTIVVFNLFYWSIKSFIVEMNECLNIKISKCLVLTDTNMNNIQPLEVVDRGSETQPQVVENLNTFT